MNRLKNVVVDTGIRLPVTQQALAEAAEWQAYFDRARASAAADLRRRMENQ